MGAVAERFAARLPTAAHGYILLAVYALVGNRVYLIVAFKQNRTVVHQSQYELVVIGVSVISGTQLGFIKAGRRFEIDILVGVIAEWFILRFPAPAHCYPGIFQDSFAFGILDFDIAAQIEGAVRTNGDGIITGRFFILIDIMVLECTRGAVMDCLFDFISRIFVNLNPWLFIGIKNRR
jgi:hypothetical protein